MEPKGVSVPARIARFAELDRLIANELPEPPAKPDTCRRRRPPGRPGTLPPRVRLIVSAIAESHHVTAEEVLGGRSTALVVAARREICWQLANVLHIPASQIGRYLGIHHTTVLFHLGKIKKPAVKLSDWSVPDFSGEWDIA